MSKDLTYCSNYYRQVSFPNLIDHDEKEDAAKLFRTLFPNEFILDDAFDCYPYFLKAMWHVFFPRCNANRTKGFIVSSYETWQELTEACFAGQQSSSNPENLPSTLLSSDKYPTVIFYLPSLYFSNTTFDYKYLPSTHGPIQCYYEKVRCESHQKLLGQ